MKNVKNLALCILAISCFNVNAQKSWKKLSDVPGKKRNSGISFGIDNKIYLGLGQDSLSKKLNDFYEYDISKNSWKQLTTFPGAGLFASSSFVVNGKGYVCFGASTTGTPQKEVWEYEPTTDKWTKKTNFPGNARYGVSWFLINDTAFLITGSLGGSPYLNEVWMYLPSSDTWVQKSNFPGGSRVHGVGFTLNNVGYFGTGISNSTTATQDVWKYNKKSDTWTQVKNYPVKITGTIAFVLKGKGYLGTGYDLSKISKDWYIYNDTTNIWTILDSIPSTMSVRGGSVAFVSNNVAYIGPGYGVSTSKSLNDFWGYYLKESCSAKVKTQPKSQYDTIGNSSVFVVEAIDTPVYYKWQSDEGYGFKDISNTGQYSGVFTSKLTIKNLNYSSNNKLKFRCVTNNLTCYDTSTSATLNVICKKLFQKEPVDAYLPSGNDTIFYSKPLNSNVVLRWQILNGAKYENLSNSGQYFGYDKDTLMIFKVSPSNNGQKFRCMGSYSGCIDSTSSSILNVYCNPILKTNNAKNILVYKASNATIGVTSYFKETTYQWQSDLGNGFKDLYNAGQYSGVNNDSLKIINVSWQNDNQKFRCILSSNGCSDTSSIGEINVLCEKMIKSHPIDANIKDGESTFFSIFSSENNTTFKWQINKGLGMEDFSNSGQFSGVANDTLQISNVTLSNHRNIFRCITYADGCYDTSKEVVLNVTCPQLISKQPINKTGIIGNQIYLSISSAKLNSSYKWQSNIGFGFVNLSNAGQYSGTHKDTLIISNLNASNNNQNFRCIVGAGSCFDTSKIAIVYSNCKSLIETQPKNKTAYINSNTFLAVKSFETNSNYSWQSDIGFGFLNLSNAGQYSGVDKDTLYINNVNSTNDNQKFRCVMKKGECSDTSGYAVLTVKLGGVNIEKHETFFEIFPNPGNEFIIISKNELSKINKITIFDESGRNVLSENLLDLNTKINISGLAKGIYIIRTSPVKYNKKFIKL